jgi:hypothetical protein
MEEPLNTSNGPTRAVERDGYRTIALSPKKVPKRMPRDVRQAKPGKGESDVDSRRQSGNLSSGTQQV